MSFIILGCPIVEAMEELGLSDIDNKREEFLTWAFGDSNGKIDIGDSYLVWNERHSDIFVVKASDVFYLSIKRMINAWMEKKNV